MPFLCHYCDLTRILSLLYFHLTTGLVGLLIVVFDYWWLWEGLAFRVQLKQTWWRFSRRCIYVQSFLDYPLVKSQTCSEVWLRSNTSLSSFRDDDNTLVFEVPAVRDIQSHVEIYSLFNRPLWFVWKINTNVIYSLMCNLTYCISSTVLAI